MGCAQGSQARLCFEPGASPHTFDTSSEPYEFLREKIVTKHTLGVPDGIRGTRSEASERARFGPSMHGGPIYMNVSPADLANILPRALGANASGTTFALAETLQPFGVMIDRVTAVFAYADCYIDKLMLMGRSGGGEQPDFIQMVMQILAKSSDNSLDNGSLTYPTLTLGVTAAHAPYVFSDSVFTLGGAARETNAFRLLIDNAIQPRWVNSRNPTALCPTRRVISLQTAHPFDADTDDLHGQALAGATGSLAITNGTVSTTFSFAKLQVPQEDPNVEGKQEIDLELMMVARKDGSTAEMTVTNDSTP